MRPTNKQEDMIRITLFHARYKTLNNEGLSPTVRFCQAIIDTADDKVRLDDHPEIVAQWLLDYGHRRRKGGCK